MKKVNKGFSLILAAMLVFSFLNTRVQAANNGNISVNETVRNAVPATFSVSIDNGDYLYNLEEYKIDGCPYFRLRNLALALDRTNKNFDVNWDKSANAIYIMTATSYSETGGRLSSSKGTGNKTAFLSLSKIFVDGQETTLTTYNIGGYNYIKLSELAASLDFWVAGDGNYFEIDTASEFTGTANKIFRSKDIPLSAESVNGVKSRLCADLNGDGQKETAEIIVSQDTAPKWLLVYKGSNSETSIQIFKGNENGFVTSIVAGHILSENSIDFLVSTNLLSMPFGGCGYELYSFKDGVFNVINISEITDGTEFEVSVNENDKNAKLSSNGSEKTVELSETDLSDYKLYGKEFCQNFFVDAEFKTSDGRALPDLVTTEVIAASLPNTLTYLHTIYRYIDGVWKIQSVQFYDYGKAPDVTKSNAESTDSLVLYSLADDYFNLPLTQIPYYQKGSIQYLPNYVFVQYKEGHQPWLSGAVDVVTVNCSNLIGSDTIVRQILNGENVELHTAKELKTKNGIDIKVIDETGKQNKVEMTVPGLGRYDITLVSPASTAILYVRKIIYSPDIQQNEQSDRASTLIYSIEGQLGLASAPEQLPDYEGGSLVFSQLTSYDEWNAKGGHQPWRREPFDLSQVVTSNLVPENISPDYLKTGWTKSGNKAINADGVVIRLIIPYDNSLDNPSNAITLIYQMTVPNLGSYDITVSRPYDSVFFIVTKIIFKPDYSTSNVADDLAAWLKQYTGSSLSV
jgi:hypothetical protein